MEYQDFNIRIMSKQADGFLVSVESPAGNATAVINLPFEIGEVLGHIRDIGGIIRGGNGNGTREVAFEAEDVKNLDELGAELYDALFTGDVQKLYFESYGQLRNDPNLGLRIKLRLNLDDPDVCELAQIPWEYVREGRDYLALSKQTPIVRYIDVQRGVSTHKLDGGLRILVVMSSPNGLDPLDLEKERSLIESTWAEEENVSVDFLEHPTRESFREALLQKHYHVLHYMGHGAYDEASGVGVLILEDENRDPTALDPDTLGAFLRDEASVRLVFLNACNTARLDDDEPFAGVANRLVMTGVPAVVAMQFPITDDAAIDFSRAFYSRLVAGFPVDEATAQGRKAILAGKAGTIEWGTPVLYMRAPDGRLFDAPDAVPDAAQADAPAPQPAAEAPAAAADGGSSKLGMVALGVTGIVAIVAIGALAVTALLDGGPNFEWYPEEAAFDVGVAETIQLRIREEDDSFDYYDDGYEIELRSGSDAVIVERTDEAQMWEWTVNVQDLGLDGGDPVLEGSITLEARIREVADGEIAKILETDFNVTVDTRALASYNAAMAAFSDDSVSAVDAVSSYVTALSANEGAYLSTAMRGSLDAGVGEAIDQLHEAARAAASDQDVPLADRVARIEEWQGAVSSTAPWVSANADSGLLSSLETLRTRAAVVDDVIICRSQSGCDTSAATATTSDPLWVYTSPRGVSGLSCQWVGPRQEKDCTLNENRNRQLNFADQYDLVIRNAQGDIVSRQSIAITN